MINLTKGDSRPIYEQITEKIKELIISGILKEEEQVPSVRELARELAINPNTIQKAYKNLESEGYIYAKPAKGYFVLIPERDDFKKEKLLSELAKITNELNFLNCKKEEIENTVNKIYERK